MTDRKTAMMVNNVLLLTEEPKVRNRSSAVLLCHNLLTPPHNLPYSLVRTALQEAATAPVKDLPENINLSTEFASRKITKLFSADASQ